MPKITITIDKKGRAVIQAEGFTGTACTQVTKNLEAALGGATSQEVTRDYYEPDLDTQQEVHRG
jgi:hypothetical protein